jgi:hypothetical protein
MVLSKRNNVISRKTILYGKMTKWLGTPGIMGQDNKKKNYQKPSHYSNILIEIATILTTS